jgi:hypothetical protein
MILPERSRFLPLAVLLAAAFAGPAAASLLAATGSTAEIAVLQGGSSTAPAAPPSAAAGPAAGAPPATPPTLATSTPPATAATPPTSAIPGAPATAATPAGAAAATSTAARRMEIPSGPAGKPFPYTVELPAGWQVMQGEAMPGVFLGPAGIVHPETDPRAIYVRISPASLADPAAVVMNIKASAPADNSWTAPIVEVREVGGMRGVLVRMDSGAGIQARSTLVLKLPLGQTSVDLMATAPRDEFERQLAMYQRVMFSVLPVPPPAPPLAH